MTWPIIVQTDGRFPESIDLDGQMAAGGHIEYWGKATRQPDGTYVCLARVGDALCSVEVRLTPLGEPAAGEAMSSITIPVKELSKFLVDMELDSPGGYEVTFHLSGDGLIRDFCLVSNDRAPRIRVPSPPVPQTSK